MPQLCMSACEAIAGFALYIAHFSSSTEAHRNLLVTAGGRVPTCFKET